MARKLFGLKLLGLLTAMGLLSTVGAGAAEKYIVQNAAPTPGAPFLDVYVANRLGFFSDEGLQVEMRHSANASQALQLATSGAADIARTTYEPYLSGYEKGMRGKFYMLSYAHNIFFVGVPKSSNINRVEDLKGLKFGVVNMGSGSILVTRSMLKMAGLPHDNSIFLPVGAGPSALQALERGTVSALSLWDSGYSSIERLGANLRYIQHPTIGSVGNAAFFISDDSLKNRREDHIRFIRAVAKARIWISRNPDAAVQVYWDSVPNSKFGDTPEQQRATALKEITFMDPYPVGLPARDHGRFDFNGLEKYMQIMKEEGVAPASMKATDVCSNELLDKVGAIDVESVAKRKYVPSSN